MSYKSSSRKVKKCTAIAPIQLPRPTELKYLTSKAHRTQIYTVLSIYIEIGIPPMAEKRVTDQKISLPVARPAKETPKPSVFENMLWKPPKYLPPPLEISTTV